MKNLFYDIGHSLLYEATCRKTVLQLSAYELERIRKAAHDKQIFVVVDERTASGILYLNVSWKPSVEIST